MNLKSHLQQALTNIRAAKLRSFLAVLGILVGTAAVVALLSSGRLATDKALAQFKTLGTNLLSISVYPNNQSKNKEAQITLSQWRQLKELSPQIREIAPYTTAYQPTSFEGQKINASLIGADESLAKIINIQMAQGHFVSFVETYEHFCVVGHEVYQEINRITTKDPLGQQLKIGQSLYTIIGIAKPWKENGFFNDDINHAVILPISGMALLNKDIKINHAIMLMAENTNIDDTIEQMKHQLHQFSPDLNFFVRSAKQLIESMESQGKIFTLLLAVIGGISLLVGGIGVMNVMLVSVSERKKEIGIRKAIGATNRDIQTLFLAESVMLSLVGGTLGVILGICLTWVIALFSQWPFTIYIMPPIAGFAVSVITGIFFGFYPAKRAAMLEPIVSLRSGV